jgi:hypothetical protein
MAIWMLCQYSSLRLVSSEKHEAAAETVAEEEGWLLRVVTVTVVAGDYLAVAASLTAIIRLVNSTKV